MEISNYKEKEATMPTNLTDNQLKKLYNLALSCCGQILNPNPSSQIQFNQDISPARMRVAVNLAIKESPFFRSCVTREFAT